VNTTKDHGTGLGLAIAHTVVSLHGGSLTVDDAPLGGARFRVMLPG
jgi:signal transduction histidine kinase